MKTEVDLRVDMGVSKGTNLNFSAGYPTTASQALLKIGHRWTPKGRSIVGSGSCSRRPDILAINSFVSSAYLEENKLDEDLLRKKRVSSRVRSRRECNARLVCSARFEVSELDVETKTRETLQLLTMGTRPASRKQGATRKKEVPMALCEQRSNRRQD